jgi:orotidine-5'-phosphate decarboxylase
MIDSPVIVALDFSSRKETLDFVARLPVGKCRLKVGFELFVACGPALIEELHRLGFEVFLDLKFHDIPNTVASVCRVAADLGVWMLNVHASGGLRMMAAAREAVDRSSCDPYLIAVTVLTSMASADLQQIGIATSPEQQVHRLALLAQEAGVDGVVCSAREAAGLRTGLGQDFLLVTPGIRPPGGHGGDDQRRVMTPAEAMAAGSNYLVIGRPITRSPSPRDTLNEVLVSVI